MIDFDNAFEEYVMNWYKSHSDEFEDAGELEERMPELYEQWALSPNDAAGGISPRAYFERYKTATELVDLLIESCKEKNNPCSLLLDRIASQPICAASLTRLLQGDGSVKLKMISVNLLTEMGESHPLDVYADWIADKHTDVDLLEIGVEVLTEHADAVAEKLYALLPAADLEQKKIIAEILVNAKQDERTYKLLTELFATGDNIPLYAGYLGKYGDERASAMLYRALDSCNYLEYIEIKNAIERMGGIVDDEGRDFTDDVYYAAIKNIK